MYEPQTGAVRGRGRTENNKSEMDWVKKEWPLTLKGKHASQNNNSKKKKALKKNKIENKKETTKATYITEVKR